MSRQDATESEQDHEVAPPTMERITRGEAMVVFVVLVLAIVVRTAAMDTVTVEHFDEGVYASGVFCEQLTPAYTYPEQHLYAPPLWPNLLQITTEFFGAGAAIWPGVLFGIATVVLIWWVGRSWYGPTGGVIAAAVLAMTDGHVQFSRTALTDVPMAFWMLAGVFAGWRAMLTRSVGWLVAAGVLAGVSWSTKYNGWLTLAVIGSASVAWRFVERKDAVVVATRPLVRFLAIAVIAGLVWFPTWWSLQDVGGYAAVSENHKQYFVGPFGWWDSAMRQLAMMQAASPSGTVWPMVGLLAFGGLAIRPLTKGVSFFLAAVLGTRALLLMFVVPSLGTSIKSLQNLSGGVDQKQSRKLATWMTLAWLFGLTLAIPLYTPYLRLVVPLLPVGCLAWADLATRHDRVNWGKSKHTAIAAAIILVAFGLRFVGGGSIVPVDDRGHTREIAEQVLDTLSGESLPADVQGIALYVYGEPGVFFQLASREVSTELAYLTQPAGNDGVFERATTDTRLSPYVVIGPHSEERFQTMLNDARVEMIGRFTARPSRLVTLDRLPPDQAFDDGDQTRTVEYALLKIRDGQL